MGRLAFPLGLVITGVHYDLIYRCLQIMLNRKWLLVGIHYQLL